jgi:hypothetical protein
MPKEIKQSSKELLSEIYKILGVSTGDNRAPQKLTIILEIGEPVRIIDESCVVRGDE